MKKCSVLLDNKRAKICNYYLPIFEKSTAFHSITQWNRIHTAIVKLVLDSDKLKKQNLPIFCVQTDIKPTVIVRLDVAESILRRNPAGIMLQEINTQ